MADDGENDAEGDDVLFRELQTTAVYDSLQRQPPERHILTLSRAEAEYAPLADALAAPNRAAMDSSGPEIVVQLRKRAGRVQLLFDGFVSDGAADADGVLVHELAFHKGLHEDWETKTRVLSPLAIIAAVEDGQLPLQSVKVSVWQSFETRNRPIGEAVMLAEVNLQPHRVTDVRCAVVRAPFPLTIAHPPVVTIPDGQWRDAKIAMENQARFLSIVPNGLAAAWNILAQNPGATLGALAGYATRGALVTFLGWLAGRFGMPVVTHILDPLRNPPPVPAGATPGAQAGNTVNVLYEGIRSYLNTRPYPKERDVTFTLEEFAKALETLAILKPLNDPNRLVSDPIAESKSVTFRHERAIWHWLATKRDGDADPNSILVNFGLNRDASTTVRVRLSVDDPMACAPETQHHEIRCVRTDGRILGAAASGVLHDLRRVQHAIKKMVVMLSTVVSQQGDQLSWADRNFLEPIWYAVQKRFQTAQGVQGIIRNATRFTAQQWTYKTSPNGPDQNARVEWFRTIQARIEEKLIRPFFEPEGPVSVLLQSIEDTLNNPQAPLASPKVEWVRRLPQRVRSSVTTSLFARGVDYSTEYADVFTKDATVREFTPYAKLAQLLTRTMKQGGTALRRFVRGWEAHQITQVALECMCLDARVPATGGFRDAPRWSTLTLSTPVDVQFASAIVSVPERTQRQLRFVARRAQQQSDKSVLEALGLAHTNADLLACQTFGDLWVAELLAMHEARNSRQVQMLEQASQRAVARLRAAGDLLLRLVVGDNPSTEAIESVDVAPSRSAIALVATQAGRDAGRLLERVLFSEDYALVRATMVPLIRSCAHACTRAASAFAKQVPTRLPHGPAASLFGDRHDGVAAFLRARSMTSDPAIVSAITAAYPAVRLLDASDVYGPEQATSLRMRAPAKRAATTPGHDAVAAMRSRLAALQMEPSADDVENLTVDELADALAVVKLGDTRRRSFYVPFGCGNTRPAPTFPPCAAPMFGTVPVFCDELASAFKLVQACLYGAQPSDRASNSLCVLLNPVLDCLPDPNQGSEVETAHPNVLQVDRVAGANGQPCVRVTYAASRAPDADAPVPPTDATDDALAPTKASEVRGAAGGSDATYVEMSARVSSIAWNAERVVQAVVAAVASAAPNPDGLGAIELALTLPPDSKGRSHWYVRTDPPFFLSQRDKQIEENAMFAILRLDLHLYTYEMLVTEASNNYLAQMMVPANGVDQALADARTRMPNSDWVVMSGVYDAILATIGQAFLDADDQQVAAALSPTISQTQAALKAVLKIPFASSNARIANARRLLQAQPVAQALPLWDDEESRRALVGALGLGVAMLAPLLQGVRITCAPIALGQRDAECTTAVTRLVGAFDRCKAVRLSEACLLVSEHMRSR